jgi:uncharacterized protein (DUF885 family)
MGRVFEIADAYVEQHAALDPIGATLEGLPGHDHETTDYSPTGIATRNDLDKATLAALEAATPDSDYERIGRDFMMERLHSAIAVAEAGEHLRPISILRAPSVQLRQVFDLMPKGTESDWSNIAARLHLVPRAMTSYRASLEQGLREGRTSAQRQAIESAKQAEVWSGQGRTASSFFHRLARGYKGDALKRDLVEGAGEAARSYAQLAHYLRNIYASRAVTEDGVGEERYLLHSREYNGCELDPRETYEWAWDELYRIQADMERTADAIKPGATVLEAVDFVAHDPARRIEGVEAYQRWLQELHDEAIAKLDGPHFDVPEQIKRIEVMIPPPGGALAAYYTPPAEDFSTPGRTWWPVGSMTVFPLWDRVTIAYHEGVPGHHFQVGAARCLGDRLSRYQKALGFVSGYGEGWALYAERLMGELGYLENPDYYLGMLTAQALRAYRVIVDIGMHLGLRIPDSESFHASEVWTHDLAFAFGLERANQAEEFLRSEVVRYLGMPAQAISYKVGEREWLKARESARSRFGHAFDLKRFHTAALDLGPLNLEMLAPEVERALAAAT